MNDLPKVMILMSMYGEYARGMLRGIVKYSQLHGPWVFYNEQPFYKNKDERRKKLSELKSWGAEGIIMHDDEMIEDVLKLGVPTIAIHNIKNQIPGVPRIIPDPQAFAKMAVEYYLGRGFREFAYCGYSDRQWSKQRGRFFCEEIIKAGYQAYVYEKPRPKMKRAWHPEEEKWLKSLPKPVGIMACNDNCAKPIAEACRVMNIRVPNEVAILGVDNDEFVCGLSNPPLSSITTNVEHVGYEAAELLSKFMNKKEKPDNQIIVVEPLNVITRYSTDITTMDDPEVSEAISFIRRNAKKPIQIVDVLNHVAVSRRVLQKKFRKSLGHSIHQEIKHARIELISALLLETNMSMLDIALSLGFPGVENLARYFKQGKIMTPLIYRKKYGHR